MNIQEAAQMIRSGCFLRRGSWANGKHCGLDGYGLFIKMGSFEKSPQMHFLLGLDDLLADDWEMFIPQYPNKSNRPTFRPSSGRPDRLSFPHIEDTQPAPGGLTLKPPRNAKTKAPRALPLTLKKP